MIGPSGVSIQAIIRANEKRISGKYTEVNPASRNGDIHIKYYIGASQKVLTITAEQISAAYLRVLQNNG